MWSISRSKVNKKVGGDSYVPFWGFVQEPPKKIIWDRIKSLPISNSLFSDAKILSHICATPRLNNFSETFHEREYGKDYPNSQGNLYPYKSWINRSNCIS